MSLRKSPVRTPALLAANRRNAQKSTGPHTRRGKAWARLNRLKHGADSVEYFTFLKALVNAPPGKMLFVAVRMLRSMPVVHPLYRETAVLAIETELALRRFDVSPAGEREKEFYRFEAGMLLKTNKTGTKCPPKMQKFPAIRGVSRRNLQESNRNVRHFRPADPRFIRTQVKSAGLTTHWSKSTIGSALFGLVCSGIIPGNVRPALD